MSLTRPVVLTILAIMLLPATAAAQRDGSKTDADRARRIGEELRGADRTINRVYAELMETLPVADRAALRAGQRTWLKTRDTTCGIASSTGDRESWLAALIRDYQKTVCVVRLTGERVSTLNQYQRDGFRAAASRSDGAPIYQIESDRPLSRGKWYFEVTVDEPAVLRAGESTLFIGVTQKTKAAGAIDEDGHASGTLLALRRLDKDLQKTVYGFAVDLDNGRLYTRDAGAWDDGAPGSAGGMAITPGREYVAYLNSSIALDALIAARAVVMNIGAENFAYAIPDGYRPFPPPGVR
jgi:uncharacterized protein YecT (DUF1311 family)